MVKGHVPTPDQLCEKIVRRLFRDRYPSASDRILYPGCGDAPFAAAVERVCDDEGWEYPEGVGIESNPEHLTRAKKRDLSHVEFVEGDFLSDGILEMNGFDFIVGNPPYVPIEGLDDQEKTRYKAKFSSAVGRFDLYILFFERSLSLLNTGGVLSFITPEKFEYVDTATPLRRLLTRERVHVESIEHVDEDSFEGLITFPTITTIRRKERAETRIKLRNGSSHKVLLPSSGESWAAAIRGYNLDDMETGVTLDDITIRVSCGIATGADDIFEFNRNDVPEELEPLVRPTVSGKQLRTHDGPNTDSVFICPYRDDGTLPPIEELGEYAKWVENHRDELENRYSVSNGGTAWYGWHENPPLEEMLQPKIVWKDITDNPHFWPEKQGNVVPKHSVYYAVPEEGVSLDELVEYLNSDEVRRWLEANCQRAANGFYRLQSRVLKQLPVPRKWAKEYQTTLSQ